MRGTSWLLAGAMLAVLVLLPIPALRAAPPSAATGADHAQGGVSEARFRKLARGVNIAHWFSQTFGDNYTAKYFEKHDTAADIDLIKSLGFTCVRLPIDPKPMFDEEHPGQLPQDYLKSLDRAIQMILSRRLAVIIDIHTLGPFLDQLRTSDQHVEHVARFWRALAKHLSQYDPDMLFLELLNEPQVKKQDRWRMVIRKVAAAARAGAPRHTLIVSGKKWSGIDQLLAMQPLDDPNVIYNFHFYNPGIFTHQGANWAPPPWSEVKNVPYPSSPQKIAPLLSTVDKKSTRKGLVKYGRERWNAEKLDALIAKAAAWGRRHHVRVTCNEFGVYKKYAPHASRARWIHDTRQAFEKHDIGWAMWNYRSAFGLVTKKNGKRVVDPTILAALGLDGRKEGRRGRGDAGR